MICPKCNYEQYCPCESCKDKLPEGKKAWIWIDGELIKCGNCGFTHYVDWWEYKQYEQINKIKR